LNTGPGLPRVSPLSPSRIAIAVDRGRRMALLGTAACLVGPSLAQADPASPAAGQAPTAQALSSRLVAGDAPGLVEDFGGRLEKHWPHRLVPRGAQVSALEAASASPPLAYQHAGQARSLDEYLRDRRVTGLMAIHGEQVLFERYAQGHGPQSRFLSASMAKSVVGLLVGLAHEDGHLRSLDDPAEAHVAELRGHVYGSTPLRDLLQMSSGVRFRETYDGQDDLSTLIADTVGQRSPGGAAAVLPYRHRRADPGRLFHYASADTQVLGLVLRAAVGMPVAEYLSTRLWQPMGAEAPASFLVDAAGQEATFAFMHATLRDFGRLGQLLANGGVQAGRAIVPGRWLAQATDGSAPHRQAHVASAYFGYGYHFWTFPGPSRQFALLGVRGQAIFVDPGLRLALVQTAVWASAGDRQARAEQLALWQALVDRVAATRPRAEPGARRRGAPDRQPAMG
jgi:CubicO group peptidase (beta-lactamase class C family)